VSLVNNVLNDDTNVIAAVPRDGPLHGLSKEGDRRYAYIRSSFNAGIYVINLDNWRAQGISEKIRQIALSNRKTLIYKNGSQPPMAIAIEENFEHLPPTWNVAMSDVEEVNDQFMEETCLMHWNGPFKPWNKDNRKDYHVELWLRYGEQIDRRERQHDRLRRSVLEIENMAV
jgi:lipopolysaccharide biosynthesis glycosyltransferase